MSDLTDVFKTTYRDWRREPNNKADLLIRVEVEAVPGFCDETCVELIHMRNGAVLFEINGHAEGIHAFENQIEWGAFCCAIQGLNHLLSVQPL